MHERKQEKKEIDSFYDAIVKLPWDITTTP